MTANPLAISGWLILLISSASLVGELLTPIGPVIRANRGGEITYYSVLICVRIKGLRFNQSRIRETAIKNFDQE